MEIVPIIGIAILFPLIFSFSVFFLAYTAFASIWNKIFKRKLYKNSRVAKWSTLGVIGPLIIVFSLFLVLDKLMCSEIGKPPVVSPDGTYEVQITDHDCGATTSFFSNIVVRETKKLWPQKSAIAGLYHVSPENLDVVWKGNREIEVSSIGKNCVDFRDFSMETKWKDIAISYVSCKK